MRKILIYGDSNVWGDNLLGNRIPDNKQWPNILQTLLKKEFILIANGLPGRIAGDEESIKYKNGIDMFLSTFRSASPIDILIISLGANDLQIKYNKSYTKILNDLMWYKKILEEEYKIVSNRKRYFKNKIPRIIYILPVNFKIKDIFNKESEEKRKKLIKDFRGKKDFLIIDEISLFDDGIHLDYNGHKKMADEVKKVIYKNE